MTQTLAPLAAETLERLRQISTPTLSTQLLKVGFRSPFLHGLLCHLSLYRARLWRTGVHRTRSLHDHRLVVVSDRFDLFPR